MAALPKAPSRQTEGRRLTEIVERYTTRAPRKERFWLLSAALALFGLIPLIAPRACWKAAYGWRYKNAEPSGGALIAQRVTGGMMVLAGVILLFI